ncbi:MAG: tetratricopeptide repeat protein [Chthoniobacteraceae bacterium]
MNFASRQPIAAIVCFAGATVAVSPAQGQAPAPGQPLPLDFKALEQGKEALNQQKYEDAVKAFEELLKSYPQSPAVPEALFRLGYAYYLGGNYDKSVENFQKVPTAKGAPAEIVELASSLIPQVLATKASKLDPKDPVRNKTLKDALNGFDAFLEKFPNSEEVESANYGKAIAHFQLQEYVEAAAPLRLNLQKFPTSESIQDSQFTLALILGTEGVAAMQKSTGAPDPAALAKFDEGEKLLRDIVTKRLNVALMNDAQFQLGEMLSARASFTEADKKDQREATFKKALDAYRGVLTKEQVVAAQKARVENVNARRIDAGKKQDLQLFKKLQRVQEKELEKLAGFEQRGDETITAKLKSGQIFFQLNKLDEARVLLSFIEPIAESDDVKKEVSYYITMSYALQGLMDKAEERYKAFQGTYKGDQIAQNLQLVMAAGFLSGRDPKAQKPEKAIEYCKEGIEIYPKGRFVSDLLNVQASALIGLKRYDEAKDLLKKFIETKPPKELAADAEFNLAIIFKDTGKVDESVKTFKAIRDKYKNTRQAEQAWYWVGELGLDTDPKAAVAELKAFVAQYSSSELLPQALFALGRGETATNQNDEALKTFTELQKKYPKSEVAPYTYFERAKIMNGRQAFDECLAIMKEFVTEYPDSPSLYQAYDFMAQILGSQSKGTEAIEMYSEYLKKRPDEPSAAEALLKLNSLWKGYSDAQGPVLAQDEKKRAEWTKGIENSIAAGEKILEKFPDSAPVALALSNLLEVQKTKLRARLVTDADIEKYFEELATKAEGKPAAQSKIRFTLSSFLSQKDKDKARKMMGEAYKSDLKYAPEDIDLYGKTLLAAKEFDQALEVYGKLSKDYPIPAGVEQKKAPKQIQEAQAIALAGEGNALLGKKQNEAAAKKFKELEENYAWSPKMMEVNYGIAQDLHDKKQDDEALKRLLDVVKNSNASSELRAKSMLLLGNIHEEAGRFDAAIDNYIKIGTFYSGIHDVAAEGLWLGAQLLERQGRGELPMPTPPPKATPGPKAAPKAAGTPPAKPEAAPAPDKKA